MNGSNLGFRSEEKGRSGILIEWKSRTGGAEGKRPIRNRTKRNRSDKRTHGCNISARRSCRRSHFRRRSICPGRRSSRCHIGTRMACKWNANKTCNISFRIRLAIYGWCIYIYIHICIYRFGSTRWTRVRFNGGPSAGYDRRDFESGFNPIFVSVASGKRNQGGKEE